VVEMKNIDALMEQALKFKENGLSEKEIATELHLSVDTVTWLLTRGFKKGEKPPADVKIGWKSIGVFGRRIGMASTLFSDIILEEIENLELEDIDVIIGIALNGIPYGTFVSDDLDKEFCMYRPPTSEGTKGTLCSNYASVKGKKVVIVDDVLSTGQTAKSAINCIRDDGAEPVLMVVMVNKTALTELEGVPLRSIIRARTIQ
jgi:orotate phosphoribosyltransferase